jgi:uncharacterized protein (DUF1778 family)
MPEKRLRPRPVLRANIPVSIPVTDVERIDDAAELLGKSRSEFIREAAVEKTDEVLSGETRAAAVA